MRRGTALDIASAPVYWIRIGSTVSRTLPIMLFSIDVSRRAIFCRTDSCPFSSCHDSISLRSILHSIDSVLLPIKAGRLALVELATGNAPVDPLFLIHLPLIDHRSVRLCRNETRQE